MILSMKSLIKRSIVLGLLVLNFSKAHAIDYVAVREFGENLEINKETLVLNVGSLDGYVEGEVAHVFKEVGTKNFPDAKKIGLIELVKIFPKYSYWQFHKGSVSANDLKAVDGSWTEVGLIRQHTALNGRALDVRNKIRLFERESSNIDLNNYDKEIPKELRQVKNYAPLDEEVFEVESLKRADVEVSSNDYLIKKSGTTHSEEHLEELEELYAPKLKVVKNEVVEKAVKADIADKLADNYERNKERTKYGMSDFYKEQEKHPEIKDIRKKISTFSVYDQEKQREFDEAMISKRALKKMDRDKERWSQDMDDTVLRRYFVQNGIEAEYVRREKALNELEGHEIWLRYFGGLNRSTNDVDNNYQRLNASLAVGYNLHFSRINDSLKNWSMDFYLENAVNHYAINDKFNAEAKDLFTGANLNYYFLNNPLTLNKFIGYFGVGMKLGQGNAATVDINRTYSYQILGLPTFNGGIKYRFRTGDLTRDTANVGAAAAFGVTYERLNYSSAEQLENNEIYPKFTTNNLKYFMGLHFYF